MIRSSDHEDSAGHKGTIEAGGVQWMCAVSFVDFRLAGSHSFRIFLREEASFMLRCRSRVLVSLNHGDCSSGWTSQRRFVCFGNPGITYTDIAIYLQYKMVEPSYQELGREGFVEPTTHL